MRIVNSKNNYIFYGLVDRSMLHQKVSWKGEGTVGCLFYNSRVYKDGEIYTGEETHSYLEKGEKEKQKGYFKKSGGVLAKSGDTVEIRVNKLFK